MAEENPKKTEPAGKAGTTVLDNETLPANVDTGDVAEVLFDDDQEGVTGTALAEADRPTLFKIDHKKGFIHPWDDDEEKYDSLEGVIVNARSYYRRFGPSGVVCESDNGEVGFDQDLKREISCKKECELSYALEGQVEGKCGLGLQLQMLVDMDGQAIPIQFNGSSTSARNFANFLKKLNRKNLQIRQVTTKVSGKFVKGRKQDYYAAKFEVSADSPCFDISALVAEPQSLTPEATEV